MTRYVSDDALHTISGSLWDDRKHRGLGGFIQLTNTGDNNLST